MKKHLEDLKNQAMKIKISQKSQHEIIRKTLIDIIETLKNIVDIINDKFSEISKKGQEETSENKPISENMKKAYAILEKHKINIEE